MYRLILGILFISAIAFAQTLSFSPQPNPGSKNSLKGRHCIELKIGIYDDTEITNFTTTEIIGSNIVTNASIGVLGAIAYQYWFANYLAFRIEAGALVTSVDRTVRTNIGPTFINEVSTEVATVTPVLTGINFYPLQISDNNIVLPYISAYAGPYVGIYSRSEVDFLEITRETVVETVIGARLGAGIDFLVSSLFKLGLSAGYHFVGDFNRPIGSENNYSGPEYSLVFGFVF